MQQGHLHQPARLPSHTGSLSLEPPGASRNLGTGRRLPVGFDLGAKVTLLSGGQQEPVKLGVGYISQEGATSSLSAPSSPSTIVQNTPSPYSPQSELLRPKEWVWGLKLGKDSLSSVLTEVTEGRWKWQSPQCLSLLVQRPVCSGDAQPDLCCSSSI